MVGDGEYSLHVVITHVDILLAKTMELLSSNTR